MLKFFGGAILFSFALFVIFIAVQWFEGVSIKLENILRELEEMNHRWR